MRIICLLFFSLLLSACNSNIDDLISYTTEVKTSTPVSIEPYPEFAKLPSVTYESGNYRSPFERSNRSEKAVEQKVVKNCLQPDYTRNKQLLENYGIDALSMSGSFYSKGRQYALISAHDGSLHKVTQGSYLGLFNGKVTNVSQSELVIKELLPDGAGCFRAKETRLTVSSSTGDHSNV